jgi:hypothetical protein
MARPESQGAVLARVEQKLDGLVEGVAEIRAEVKTLSAADSHQAAQLAVHGSEIEALQAEVKNWRGFVSKVAVGVVTAIILGVLALWTRSRS